MAVVDIYDALLSKRPYRGGLTHGLAVAILRQEAEDGKLDRQAVEFLVAATHSASDNDSLL